jgi:hypothetical protein
MPLFVQSQRIDLNQTATFSFPDSIPHGSYVVGLSYFAWGMQTRRRMSGA